MEKATKKHLKLVGAPIFAVTAQQEPCGKCSVSCQTACKTSCTVGAHQCQKGE